MALTQNSESRDFETLVEQVVQEVIRKLGDERRVSDGEGECVVCVLCGQCADKVPEAVGKIKDAGAARISCTPGVTAVRKDIAPLIDHTLLKPDATRAQVEQLCCEARELQFAAVCVNPSYVKLAATLLEGTGVTTCSVVGFPLGASKKEIKAYEARRAVLDGAREIDMVMNVGAMKSGDDRLVQEDMAAVREACGRNIVLKVILETALLTDVEKVKACEIAKKVGADFVKTSTGFGPGGATVEDVRLMRSIVGAKMGVKASGGIRDTEAAEQMIAAGASRIGASASIKIVSA
jgi:deoxyribose-phosphate aldolase